MATLDPVLVLVLEQQKAGKSPETIIELLGLPPPQTPKLTASAILDYYRFHNGIARRKIASVNTLEDALRLLASAQRVLVLVGAGISVACGVPDFRTAGTGLYDALRRSGHPALSSVGDPQEIFDFDVFKEEPDIFYSVARLLYPDSGSDCSVHAREGGSETARAHAHEGSSSSSSSSSGSAVPARPSSSPFVPSLTHRFLAALERSGRLLRVYTQNIDGLEAAAGLSRERVVQCHGALDTVACLRCRATRPATHPAFQAAVRSGMVARCDAPACAGRPEALLKPGAVFFREPLPPSFKGQVPADTRAADLLLVIGSSLKVKPVCEIPGALPRAVPAILVNKEPLHPHAFDVDLLGPCDVVVEHLWRGLELPGLERSLVELGLGCCSSAAAADASAPEGLKTPAEGVDRDAGDSGDGSSSSSSSSSMSCGGDRGTHGSQPHTSAAARDDDIAIVHEPPCRYRFSSARHAAAEDATRQVMMARLDRILGSIPSIDAGDAATTRYGRPSKKPRR